MPRGRFLPPSFAISTALGKTSITKKGAPVPSSMYGKANQGKTSTGNKSNAPKPKYKKAPKKHASQKQMNNARKSMGFK